MRHHRLRRWIYLDDTGIPASAGVDPPVIIILGNGAPSMPVNSVTAGDASIVIGGTGTNPAVETADLETINSLHPSASPASLLAALGALQLANNLADLASIAIARANLGLGTAALQNSGAFDLSGAAAAAAAASVPLGSAAGGALNGNYPNPGINTVPIGSGGTGQVTAAAALAALGGQPDQAAPAGFLPANPASTVSTTLVMMGLGAAGGGQACVYAPQVSGLVLVNLTCDLSSLTAIAQITAGARFGTGSAPANGVGVTGTRWGSTADTVIKPSTQAGSLIYARTALLTLVAGTTYWFDIALATNTVADASQAANVSMSFAEIAS